MKNDHNFVNRYFRITIWSCADLLVEMMLSVVRGIFVQDTGKTLKSTRYRDYSYPIYVLQKDFYCIVLSRYNQKVQVAMLTKFTSMSF